MTFNPTYRPPVAGGVLDPDFIEVNPQASDPNPSATNYTYVDEDGRSVLVLGTSHVVQPHLDATAYGVKATDDDADADANATALGAAVARAIVLNASVRLPAGVVALGRIGTTAFHIRGERNVRVWGTAKQTRLRAKNDIANGGGECKSVRIDASSGIWLDGLVVDGGWENAGCFIADTSHLITMTSGMTIHVDDTEGLAPFPASGTFELMTEGSGAQVITYTSKTATSFINCTGGSGVLRAGDQIVRFSLYRDTTAITVASNGAAISAGTLNVDDTTYFPAAVTVAGQCCVQTSLGFAFILYTSKTSTSLVGVTVAIGSGTVATGGSVQYFSGAGGQLPALPADFTIDPNNHGIFIYGSDGSAVTPNSDIRITNCDVINTFGDGIWIGQNSTRIIIENTTVRLAARNGITFSSFADDVAINNTLVSHCHTTPIDAEPVEGSSSRIRMYNVHCTSWPNPGTANLNVVLSVVGGSVTRPAPQNKCSDWRFVNCSFTRGQVLLENCDGITFVNCKLDNVIRVGSATAGDALHISGEATNIKLIGTSITGMYGDGVVSITPYRIAGPLSGQVHSALAPGEVTFDNCAINARNGIDGVYVEAGGGYPGVIASALSYIAPSFTQPSGPNVLGELVFAADTFAGKVDYYVGRRVMVAGLLANVVANDTDTLYLAPYAENYRQIADTTGYAWVDALGRVASPPSFPATAQVLPVGGWLRFNGTTINCDQTDDLPAGGRGFYYDTTTDFAEGYNQAKISLCDVAVNGATGEGVYLRARGDSSPGVFSELELVDVKVRDAKSTPTTTVGVRFDFPQIWQRVEMHGVSVTSGITKLQGHEDIAIYQSSSSEPPQYTGYTAPEGVVLAPPGSTFVYPPDGVTYVKQTDETYSTGWVAQKTAPRVAYRLAGSQHAGVQNGPWTGQPPEPINSSDVEFLMVVSADGDGDVVFTEDGNFAAVGTDVDTHFGVPIRLSLFARRMGPDNAVPVIDASGGKFAIGRICAVKDVQTGVVTDAIEDVTQLTHASGDLAFSFGGVTSTVSNALWLTVMASHVGGSFTSNVINLATTEGSVVELKADLDQGQVTLGDRYSFHVITGRRPTAGSMGTLTGAINATGVSPYAFIMGISLALKPRVDS